MEFLVHLFRSVVADIRNMEESDNLVLAVEHHYDATGAGDRPKRDPRLKPPFYLNALVAG